MKLGKLSVLALVAAALCREALGLMDGMSSIALIQSVLDVHIGAAAFCNDKVMDLLAKRRRGER